MPRSTRPAFLILSAFALLITLASPPGAAVELSAVEQLYADLAKLDPAERQNRIVEGAKKEGALAFTQSTSPDISTPLNKTLAEDYPWLKFKAQHITLQQDSLEQFVGEERAGRHLTDNTNGGPPYMVQALALNLFARFPTPVTQKILPQYRTFLDPQNRWLPRMWSEHGISYNPDLLTEAEAPKSFTDLCNPKYNGQVGFEPAIAGLVLQIYDVFNHDLQKTQGWMECMGKNKPILMKGYTVRLNLMMAGDHAIEGDNYFYRGTMLNQKNPKKAPFKAVYSEILAAQPSGVMINRMAPHPYSAALYSDWTLSDNAQKVLKEAWRGPMTLEHPYMPADAKLAVQNLPPDAELLKKLMDMWTNATRPTR